LPFKTFQALALQLKEDINFQKILWIGISGENKQYQKEINHTYWLQEQNKSTGLDDHVTGVTILKSGQLLLKNYLLNKPTGS